MKFFLEESGTVQTCPPYIKPMAKLQKNQICLYFIRKIRINKIRLFDVDIVGAVLLTAEL